MLLISGVYLFFGPRLFDSRLDNDPYREWMMHKREPSVSVISVWHIVYFKPYVGSLGNWLSESAKRFSKSFIGIHFEVISYTPEEAEERMKAGVFPDVISFADERIDESMLESAKLPYCASGKVLLYDPAKAGDKSIEELKLAAGSSDEFKKGKVCSCITDVRGAGDLSRAQLLGKAPYFEVEPLPEEGFMLQYVGIMTDVDEIKLPYARGFLEYLVSPACQKLLSGIGLIPVDREIETDYDPEWLNALHEGFMAYNDHE